jgi:hypothetical protein
MMDKRDRQMSGVGHSSRDGSSRGGGSDGGAVTSKKTLEPVGSVWREKELHAKQRASELSGGRSCDALQSLGGVLYRVGRFVDSAAALGECMELCGSFRPECATMHTVAAKAVQKEAEGG